MNIVTIHHLCYYLEEIGIIDQVSLTSFLSLYSFVINKNKQNNNSNISSKSSLTIFENILCAYLKKIFSVEKNFKIFSNKIINKFKQLFIVKQYNGLILFFSILSKKINSLKIQSFYKILNKKKKINLNEKKKHKNNSNNNTYNNKYSSAINRNADDIINSQNSKIKEAISTSFNSFRAKYLKNNKKEKDDKSETFNKSFDFFKFNNSNYSYNNTIPSFNSRNSHSLSGTNKNIQLEFTKKKFLSKIKREHMVKFKRTNSGSLKKLKSNNSNRDFESIILSNFSPKLNSKNNIYNYNDNNKVKNNEKNLNTYYRNYKYKMQNNYENNNKDDEESLNDYIPDLLRGAFSTKSEYINFNSFAYSSPSCNNLNNNYIYKLKNKDKVGHIIKMNDKSIRNNLLSNNMEKQKNLSLNDIHKIKQKLESLNYFNIGQ